MIDRLLTVSLVAFTLASCVPRHHGKTAANGGGQKPAVATASQPAAADLVPTSAPDPQNPFEGAQFFLNPEYVSKVEAAAKADPKDAAIIKKVAAYPVATWLESIGAVEKVPKILKEADKQQGKDGKPVLSVFVVYDLPNRDCAAKSSVGELTVENGGEQRYKTEFIDKIADHFAAHPKQRIVVILEPDSLGNLVTNAGSPRCKVAANAYRQSIAYAITKLSMPQVSIYLDGAHAGWLGWGDNRKKIAKIYSEVLAQAGGADKIRGFATNVSNYNTVAGRDGKTLGPQNSCPDEITYITRLSESLEAEGIKNKKFIIDTSRNAHVVRTSWSPWCNIKGAGIGPRPQASPAEHLDAYFWIKPPGESDGTTDPKAPRFDPACTSPSSMPNAPEAGEWFQAHFVDMVKNADPQF